MELLPRISEQSIHSLSTIALTPPDPTGVRPRVELALHLIGISAIWIWVVILGVSSWIVANRMRQRIKKDTGKTVIEGDLTSIETWMKVDEVEQKKNPDHEWA